MRYSGHDLSEPLWVGDKTGLKDIPKCPACGCERKFEVQIMPQIFDLFQVLRLVDWETITIYTCTNRECVPKFADKQHYMPEVAHI
jgi:hypothetical protein